MADKVLDAKGLNCPLPILKAKKALKEVPDGGTLEVLSTDPGSVADFQAFCRTTGNELVEHSEEGGVYTFLIRKTRSPGVTKENGQRKLAVFFELFLAVSETPAVARFYFPLVHFKFHGLRSGRNSVARSRSFRCIHEGHIELPSRRPFQSETGR